MKHLEFKGLLTEKGWLMPAFVQLDEQGVLVSIDVVAQSGLSYENIAGYAIPGMQNAHSHAFQHAMAGHNERHDTVANPDDFWGWRQSMYALAGKLSPDEMEAIATNLYREMARVGYTQVAEFHYVHHDENGQPYGQLAELGGRLLQAAKNVGIGITLIPIFYQKGGFGTAPTEGQKRFISPDMDAYLRLFEASRDMVAEIGHGAVGYGLHSLRAVDPHTILSLLPVLDDQYPIHIHVAEQLKEVADCQSFLGCRPVEWLLQNVNLDARWHLVHATHMTEEETVAVAKSGAHVVLCPSTEGNLGDGLFNLKTFQDAGGAWSIGTDSHVGLSPMEELRWLDYGQRLRSHKRNIFHTLQEGDSGLYAIRQSVSSGRRAMGQMQTAFFEVGQSFDAVAFKADAAVFAYANKENLASTIVYATDPSMIFGTMRAGKWIYKNE